MKSSNEFSKPVATIKNGDTTFEIHVYRAGQSCRIAQGATMEFGASIGSKSAGLVYVTKGPHGIKAEDNHVDCENTWQWIQGWMQKGMDASPLADHVRQSIDKDNDWGPVEWEAWNTKAKELLKGGAK